MGARCWLRYRFAARRSGAGREGPVRLRRWRCARARGQQAQVPARDASVLADRAKQLLLCSQSARRWIRKTRWHCEQESYKFSPLTGLYSFALRHLTAEPRGCISLPSCQPPGWEEWKRQDSGSMAASKMSATRLSPAVALPAARRSLLISGVLVVSLIVMAVAALAAFGGSGTSSSPTASMPAPTILTGPVRPTTFAQARAAGFWRCIGHILR